MPKFFRIAAAVASLLGIWILVEVGLTVHELRETVVYVKETLPGTVAQTDAILQRLGAASDAVAEMADKQKESTIKTTQNLERMTAKGVDVLEKFDKTVTRLNEETIPQFNKTLETANIQLQNTGEETANTLAVTRKGLGDILATTNRTMSELNAIVSDPAIRQSLQNTADATKEAAEGIKQVKGVAEDTHEMTTDLKKAVKRATKPLPWFMSGINWAWKKLVEVMQAKQGF